MHGRKIAQRPPLSPAVAPAARPAPAAVTVAPTQPPPPRGPSVVVKKQAAPAPRPTEPAAVKVSLNVPSSPRSDQQGPLTDCLCGWQDAPRPGHDFVPEKLNLSKGKVIIAMDEGFDAVWPKLQRLGWGHDSKDTRQQKWERYYFPG